MHICKEDAIQLSLFSGSTVRSMLLLLLPLLTRRWQGQLRCADLVTATFEMLQQPLTWKRGQKGPSR